MKRYSTFRLSLFTSFALLTACSSDIAEVLPDGSDEIRIALGKGISRAVAGYRDWNANTDPKTMGVVAFTNGTPSPYIYNNTQFQAPEEGTIWTPTASKAYWRSYNTATALDFFAYMPYSAGTTVSQSDNTYTMTISNVPGVSAVPYLVATTPVHYASAFGNITPVQMQMDQMMTGFDFQFCLGEDMSTLRTFKITNVRMSEIPATATVAQSYTFTAGIWTKGTAAISNISMSKTSAEVSSSEGILIGYNHKPEQYKTFDASLYMLPFLLSEVTPKIEVTYDVYDQDGYKTRSTTSEILLNSDNFSNIAQTQSAHKNIVKIKIIPTKLHVLSDADQKIAGYLIVGE